MSHLFRLRDSALSWFNGSAGRPPFGRVSKAELDELQQALNSHLALFYRETSDRS